jgi:hypothetical protein
MRLTADQVRRLCGIDPSICERVLDALVEGGFLQRQDDGCYVRRTSD